MFTTNPLKRGYRDFHDTFYKGKSSRMMDHTMCSQDHDILGGGSGGIQLAPSNTCTRGARQDLEEPAARLSVARGKNTTVRNTAFLP